MEQYFRAIKQLLRRHPVWPQPRILEIGSFGEWKDSVFESRGSLAAFGVPLKIAETEAQTRPQVWHTESQRGTDAALNWALDDSIDLYKAAGQLSLSGNLAATIVLEGAREKAITNVGEIVRQLPRMPKSAGLGIAPVLVTSVMSVARASVLLAIRGDEGAHAEFEGAGFAAHANANASGVHLAKLQLRNCHFAFGTHRAIVIGKHSFGAGGLLEVVTAEEEKPEYLPEWGIAEETSK
jgi:hypothetical protein